MNYRSVCIVYYYINNNYWFIVQFILVDQFICIILYLQGFVVCVICFDIQCIEVVDINEN